jgi:hypothetical protein
MKGTPKPLEKSPKARDAPSHANALTRPAVAGGLTTGFASVQETAGNLAVQRLFGFGSIQAKLAISQPNDPSEQEADSVADKILSSTPAPSIQRRFDRGECAAGHSVQTKELTGHTPRAGPGVESSPARLRGTGEPLRASTRAFFESRFGHDFGDVRVHTDTRAARSAETLSADAYTSGRNIYFAAGKYAPENKEGKRLLAHELVHTIQQRTNAPSFARQSASPGNQIIDPGHPAWDLLRTDHYDSTLSVQRQPAPGAGSGSGAGSSAPTPSLPAPLPSTPSPAPSAATPAALNVNLVPPKWAREPRSSDFLVVRHGNQMVALPAEGSMVLLHPPEGETIPDVPFLSVATIAKEGFVAVNLGGRAAFAVDAGGDPALVFPSAMAQIQASLGVTSFRGVAVTHIHKDHVQSFLELVRVNNIPPENIHFPEAFAVNPSASPRMFAAAINALRNTTDAALRTLGHGPTAAYGAIQAPTGAAVFHRVLEEGDVTLDFYGLTAEFQQLQASRTAGRTAGGRPTVRPPNLDTASLLTRVTHRPTGFRVLYVGDLRGSDLALFQQGMGEAAYNEMLSGVRVIEGLQHHLGALESPADRAGLVELLKSTYLRTGQLTVIAQSQEQYGGRQFLNRSLIAALNTLGIDVHIALEPSGPGPGQVGSVTVETSGAVTISGGGRIESHLGPPDVREQVQRMIKLQEAEEILTKYERFLSEPGRQSRTLNASRVRLQRMVEDFLETAIGSVQTGAAGRAQPSLLNPADPTARLQRMRATYPLPGEDLLTPANMDALRELNRIGPYRETWEREVAKARETGRVSDEGIDALWELEPELAKQLVQSSGITRRAQQAALRSLPSQPMRAGSRIVGGVLLAITIFNEIAPLIAEHQRSAREEHVARQLDNIIWWQYKGVYPNMEGVVDRWWPRSNEWTTSPSRIGELLDNGDLDYLTLTGIDDQYWDIFAAWASARLQTVQDWATHILQSSAEGKKEEHYNALRMTGSSMGNHRFEYRVTKVSGATIGFDFDEEWRYSEPLNKILNAAGRHVVEVSERQIAGHAASPTVAVTTLAPRGASTPLLSTLPQPTGRKRFKQGVATLLYTFYEQQVRSISTQNPIFYVYPNSVSPYPVPEDYVVVGGANYHTYVGIYFTPNLERVVADKYGGTVWHHVYPNHYESILAKKADLEDAP